MIRKVVIIGILFLLAVLFLSTIGSYWTGYVVLNNNELSLKQYPYPFVKNSNYNALTIVIPDQSTLEEQEIANNLAKALQSTRPLPPKVVRASELLETTNKNLILIGDPCTNKLITQELGTYECSLDLKEGEGLIKLITKERTSILIISGYDIESMKKASNVLVNPGLYPLKGKEMVVAGNLMNPYTYSLIYK